MRIATFLAVLVVCYRCRSMTGSLTERCSNHDRMSNFAGPASIRIACGFTPSSWCRVSADGTQTELDVAETGGLHMPTNRLLEITNLTPDFEGEYKCREENTDYVTAQCVFAIGRANFACQHFGNCREIIEATEGAVATFDSNIVFLDGGEVNQPLISLRVTKNSGNNDLYICDLRRERCEERNRFQVVLHKGRTTQNITVTLKNLTAADAGDYEIEIHGQNPTMVFTGDDGDVIPINIRYQLQVSEAPTTELPPTTTPLPESTTLQTSEPSTTVEPSGTAETAESSTEAAATTAVSTTAPPPTEPRTDSSMAFIIGMAAALALTLIVIIAVAILLLVICHRIRPTSSKTMLSYSRNHVDKSHTVFEDSLIVPTSNPAIITIPGLLETGSGLRQQEPSGSISNNNSRSSNSNSRPSSTDTSSDQNFLREQTRNTHISQTPHRVSAIDFAGDLSAEYFSEAVRL